MSRLKNLVINLTITVSLLVSLYALKVITQRIYDACLDMAIYEYCPFD